MAKGPASEDTGGHRGGQRSRNVHGHVLQKHHVSEEWRRFLVVAEAGEDVKATWALQEFTRVLCAEAVGYGADYCRFHFLQHLVLCEAYHLRCLDADQHKVSRSTIQFTEFVLRKEFSKLFIGKDDFGHQARYAFLLDGMYEHPYPEANLAVIDEEFHADAKRYSGAVEKSKF